ncbi:hypothetical protein QN277_017727 [Acacia crassicarpa]|uniref:Uncharacterized protein n=1 Tax=Acacia crassicarpa TaxID=499986 RepID=A0AAE1KIC7_9FABA|nr:hypothetical protein QN277_017727 [Acacia crassicarpa]
MELDKLCNLEEEPHLSGAYIRNLVKQLTTSKTKDSMNPRNPDCTVAGDTSQACKLTKQDRVFDGHQPKHPTQPRQHKKQVRRRLHTSRPYQERLLNMAEARREIVTALKFHRAAMKQASEQQQHEAQQQPSVSLQPLQHQSFEQDGRVKSRRNPGSYPSCTSNFSNYMDAFSYSSLSHPLPSFSNSYTCSGASPIAPTLVPETPNIMLPNQTLGLNLNVHDFANLNAALYLDNINTSSNSYSSPSPSVATDQETPSAAISQGEEIAAVAHTIDSRAAVQATGGLHTAMDDEGLAEIRSVGEQYQMEWNDTMNLVTSAWWFRFLKSMEHGTTDDKPEDDAYHIFEEVMDFPAWLNANESCLEQCSQDYFQDPTLPW